MLGVGWHWLPTNVDPQPPLPVSTFLDLDAAAGMRSPERLARIYFKGRPPAQEIAQKALTWHQQGCRVQLANEPNLDAEGFGGDPDDYARWFADVASLAPAGARSYWAGMSPGVPDWEEWYEPVVHSPAAGIAAHAYGTLDQMQAAVEPLRRFGKPIWLAEVNFGAGQRVDVDAWTRDHFRPFLDWCAGIKQVEAVTYFAYRWATPDVALPTPVDGAGTAVEHVLRAWTPPVGPEDSSGGDARPTGENGQVSRPNSEVSTVADVPLSVPSKVALAHPGNYETTLIGKTVGVVVHSTAGKAASLELEYNATLAWFRNPQAGVSAHRVVGPAEVATCVHDGHTAWHAKRENARRRGIELAHPDTPAWAQVQYSNFQYEAAAELIARWSILDGFPVRFVTDERQPGIICHKDTVQGKADGKRDPTPPFDPSRLIAAAERWVTKLTKPPAPAGFDIEAARDRLWKEAERLENAGHVWYGQAIKSATALSKGDK